MNIGVLMRQSTSTLNILLIVSILLGVVIGCSENSNSTPDSKPNSGTDSKPVDPNLKVPAENELRSMIDTTLSDFNDAVQSGDFTEFHDKKIAKIWSEKLSADSLKSKFPLFVGNKEMFGKIIADHDDAVLSPPAAIEKLGSVDVLYIRGYYATRPIKLKFEVPYHMEDGKWRCAGLDLETVVN
ncbi:MAG TPA: hypothetical protein VHQ01_04590 [Pyrinomonadaceae bacterium]|nr:hypothetical protein [Pyrinomonadaceae bacterium]